MFSCPCIMLPQSRAEQGSSLSFSWCPCSTSLSPSPPTLLLSSREQSGSLAVPARVSHTHVSPASRSPSLPIALPVPTFFSFRLLSSCVWLSLLMNPHDDVVFVVGNGFRLTWSLSEFWTWLRSPQVTHAIRHPEVSSPRALSPTHSLVLLRLILFAVAVCPSV